MDSLIFVSEKGKSISHKNGVFSIIIFGENTVYKINVNVGIIQQSHIHKIRIMYFPYMLLLHVRYYMLNIKDNICFISYYNASNIFYGGYILMNNCFISRFHSCVHYYTKINIKFRRNCSF